MRAVVVGGRTAVWAPVPDLGAVVVLDEGDEALQEERVPTWHARDVALERARRAGAAVTLVAPLPTPEATAWTDGVVTRPERRVERNGWPAVDVVDQRAEPPGNGLLSEALARALHRTVDAGERAVCVLNRKGRAKLLTCLSCSTIATCERCDAAVIEAEPGLLTCPRCGTTRPTICTVCHHTKLRASRLGVQRLRDALAALLPRTEIAWLDATVTEVPDAPVVVGTETVLHRIPAKLVAFLDLDQELFAQRVRAGQQAAGLLARAARLVGARERGGRLLLQTHAPEHPIVRFALDGDPAPLLAVEVERRRVLGFPPFGAVAEVSGEPDAVRATLGALPDTVRVLGPSARGTGLAALDLDPRPRHARRRAGRGRADRTGRGPRADRGRPTPRLTRHLELARSSHACPPILRVGSARARDQRWRRPRGDARNASAAAGGATASQASTTSARSAGLGTRRSWTSTAAKPSKCGIVNTPGVPAWSTASLSSRSATDTARMSPSGTGSSPKRLTSALLNGRSQANAFGFFSPPTNHVRRPCRSPIVTPGRPAMTRSTSVKVATAAHRTRRRHDVAAAGRQLPRSDHE